MADLHAVRLLREAGRFAEALKVLGGLRIARVERVAADVLRADLLERTGRLGASGTMVRGLLRDPHLSPDDRSACELVLARLAWADGDIDQAIAGLQRSIRIADDEQNLERLAWAELRLLLMLSDRSGPNAVAPALSELRTHVVKSGQPALVAALHIHIAETEAKRGLIRNAERHLDIGKRELARMSNLWLEALAENVEAGIQTMRSAFEMGVHHATRCLALAEESGAASLRESALGNLGNLAYLSGQFDAATTFVSRARATLSPGSDSWRACTETLARISLAQNRLEECGTLLDEIDQSAPADDDRVGYAYRHTQLTRVRWLVAAGRLNDALSHSNRVLTLATRSGDQWLHSLTIANRADVLQQADRAAEADATLRALVPLIPTQPPELFARYEQTLACALARGGRPDQAEAHYLRARRLYVALGHRVGELDLLRQWEAAVNGGANRSQNPPPAADPLNATATTIGDIASIMVHKGQPELVAREVIGLLDAAGCVRYATAEARTADGSVEVLAQAGEPRDGDQSAARRLPVGRERARDIEVIVHARPDWESSATVNAVELLLTTVHDLERASVDREEQAALWPIDELPSEGGGTVTIGHMREMMALAKRIAGTNAGVLITGESGTGKEILARAIHAHSARAQKPFIAFNCAATPRDILESHLFGHRRGAFTGADRDHPGIIRGARDGTLFLDEIGDLALDLQPKLLRFLESGEICPVGESTPFLVDVRIVAATNANLETSVREGRFREDLFYRLNVIPLSLKPLRERRDEIPALVNHFVMLAAEEFHKQHIRLSEETMERLTLHTWPGNVRQLQNEIKRMVALADPNSVLQPHAVSPDIFKATATSALVQPATERLGITVPLTDKLNPTLARIEREIIRTALHDHHGKVEDAARALGISRKGLYLKRQRLGL
jgi:DNA-binding NtrC family response regulator/tetratricopeptide (TPR) repeat protein